MLGKNTRAEELGDPEGMESWALVGLFGHQRIGGHLSEKVFPSAMPFRVDMPGLIKDGRVVRQGFTRYFGPGAIYSIAPINEDMLRDLLPLVDGTPEIRGLSLRAYAQSEEDD